LLTGAESEGFLGLDCGRAATFGDALDGPNGIGVALPDEAGAGAPLKPKRMSTD